MDEWAELTEPWRACLELAWEAYLAGTIPVGAVVVDAEGAIVSLGRNRIFEPLDGGFGGTRLAHAEIAALSQLPATRRYEGHTLYSSLEPCLLCVGAATLSKVGAVRYAALDPYGGACNAEIGVLDFRRAAIDIGGPVAGWPAQLSTALQAAFWLGHESPVAPAVLDSFGDAAQAAGERLRALDGSLGPSLPSALPRILPLL